MAKKIYPDDDGHTIANMNVEGMPWYRKEPRPRPSGDVPRAGFRESLRDAFSIALAGALVLGCALLPIVAFIAFCTNIWFK